MKKKVILFFIGVLFFLNIFFWQEVFDLVANNNLRVDFLDVGQGDAIFIQTPELYQILIDGGPSSAVLEKLQKLMPFYDKTIDMVILTHPEKDHMQGLIEVLRRYKVNYVLWTGIKRSTFEYQEWVKALNEAESVNRTKIITDVSDKRIKAGDALIVFLNPLQDLTGKEAENTTNDTSIVSKLIFGDNSFLFTGDITDKIEKELIARQIDLKSNVLKVAHHGSKYSTSDEFLESAKPQIAVISVGKNYYGHPTPEVLQRLENFGIDIFRTDVAGDIKIISDGKNLENERYQLSNF